MQPQAVSDSATPVFHPPSTAALPKEIAARESLDLKALGPLGLGRTVLALHGLSTAGPVVVDGSFMKGAVSNHNSPGEVSPLVSLINEPVGDAYLHRMAVPALQPGETALVLRMQPDIIEYYRSLGLLGDGQRVVEVDPIPSAKGLYGFPHTDPLSALVHEGRAFESEPYISSVFPSPATKDLATRAGLRTFQETNPFETNNKTKFHREAEQWGIRTAPFIQIESSHDVREAVLLFEGASAAWMKLAHGSGGDFVRRIEGPVTKDKLYATLRELRTAVQEAFERNDYSPVTLQDFWPQDRIAPILSSIEVEQHIGDFADPGTQVINCNFPFATAISGQYCRIGGFTQNVGPNGEFRGGRPFSPLEVFPEEMLADVRAQQYAVARYVAEGIRYAGFWGLDAMLVQQGGKVRQYNVEVNARANMNFWCGLVAAKLGAQCWCNLNVWGDRSTNRVRDLADLIGHDLVYGNPSAGLVMPMAMRSMWSGDRVVQPNSGSKVMLAAPDPATLASIMRRLEHTRGLRFTSTPQ